MCLALVFAWRCFPLMGLILGFFGVDGNFPHSPGSTGLGQCTLHVLSLGWIPAVNLVRWYHCWGNRMGVRSTTERTIVCTPWISPLLGLNPQPTKGPSQTPLLLMLIGTVVPIQACMGSRPDTSQCVNILRNSAGAYPQSWTRIFGWQAMCIPMSLPPNSRVTVLSYWYRLFHLVGFYVNFLFRI